jgi:anti-sigma regulatory factor (Ser/Thr protein kinase)
MDGSPQRLTLPARVESVRLFHDFVHDGAAAAGLGPLDQDQLDLVLEEILVNVARYAYEGQSGDVAVSYTLADGGLEIEITDWGRSFNPNQAAAPDLNAGLSERPVGGLGIHLVMQIVGSLDYRRQNGQNIIAFRFPGVAAAE